MSDGGGEEQKTAARGACTACRTARCKCVYPLPELLSASPRRCERCVLLDRECVPHVSRQGQGPRQRKAAAAEADDDLDAKIAAMLRSRTLAARAAARAFPTVLHSVVSDPATDEVVRWLPCGTAFVIPDKQEFTKEILPRHFPEMTKFGSFKDRLQRWGFGWPGGEEAGYRHGQFQREAPELAGEMALPKKRKAVQVKALPVANAAGTVARGLEWANAMGADVAHATYAMAAGAIEAVHAAAERKMKAEANDAKRPAAKRRRARPKYRPIMYGHDGLPPNLDRSNRDTPAGRIYACVCRDREACREVMYRWARLGEGQYVQYLHLPQSSKGNTAVGRHVGAYRKAAMRHLGCNEDEADGEDADEDAQQQPSSQGKEKGVAAKYTTKRIAFVHFHPDVMASLLEEMDSKKNKANRWRIPTELGQRLGLTEEDKCPDRDVDGEESFFAVPTYTMEEAAADVERAEAECKRKFEESKEASERMAAEVAADPSKHLQEVRELRMQHEQLLKENEELKERMKRETARSRAAEKKTQRLARGVEKMAGRLHRWENAKRASRAAGRQATEAAEPDAEEESGAPKRKKGSGGRRWSDQRMDRAVEAKRRDPSLSYVEALAEGGYEFLPHRKGARQTEIFDADNVSLAQRKNNLMRRLRYLAKNGTETEEGDEEAGEEEAASDAEEETEEAADSSSGEEVEEELGEAVVDFEIGGISGQASRELIGLYEYLHSEATGNVR